MNFKIKIMLMMTMLLGLPAHGQSLNDKDPLLAQWGDCSHAWLNFLETSPNTPKYLSGDTMAAYAMFMFKMNRRSEVDLVLQAPSYQARFWSIETYLGRTQIKTDHLFDRDIETDDEGNWQIRFSSRPRNNEPSMRLATPRLLDRVYTIMLRVYVPDSPLRPEDMPRVTAINSRTGEPTACPTPHIPSMVDIPQQIVTLRDLQRSREIEFDRQPGWFDLLGLAGNSAVPDYRQATQRIDRPDDVAVIRFKAPSAGKHPDADTRYWSLCLKNFARNTTLACLPDFLAQPDPYGFVTVVFGRANPALKSRVAALGYNFIADKRDIEQSRRDLQRVVGFAYRNILPAEHFLSFLYQGDYAPRGYLCSLEEFLQTADGDQIPCH